MFENDGVSYSNGKESIFWGTLFFHLKIVTNHAGFPFFIDKSTDENYLIPQFGASKFEVSTWGSLAWYSIV